jgi:hypothetical protein
MILIRNVAYQCCAVGVTKQVTAVRDTSGSLEGTEWVATCLAGEESDKSSLGPLQNVRMFGTQDPWDETVLSVLFVR